MARRLFPLATLLIFTGTAYGQDWIFNPATEHWYRLTAIETNWLDAQAEAASVGGYLVTINDAAENQWIWDNFFPDGETQNRWIGLHQLPGSPEPDGGWVWDNGEPVTYTNWRSSEPNNFSEDEAWCEMAWDYGWWNDHGHLAAPQPGIIEIPEPATVWLLLAGGLVLTKRRL